MNSRFWIGLLLILLFSIAGKTMTSSFPVNSNKAHIHSPHQDTLFITLGKQLEKFVQHEMQPSQTLYSLARFYGLRANDLFDYNYELGNQISRVGTTIRIPIPNRAIMRFQGSDFRRYNYTPIYYKVRKGETLYRIARKYFRMPVDSLRFRNNIPDYFLHEGQVLHIGWISKFGIPDSIQIYNNPQFKMNFILEESFKSTSNRKTITETGVAFWQKDADLDSGLYALHNKAPLNSVIAVTNPMNNRTAFVKIIGRIPKSSYQQETVILSSQAAQVLRVKDARSLVKIRYRK